MVPVPVVEKCWSTVLAALTSGEMNITKILDNLFALGSLAWARRCQNKHYMLIRHFWKCYLGNFTKKYFWWKSTCFPCAVLRWNVFVRCRVVTGAPYKRISAQKFDNKGFISPTVYLLCCSSFYKWPKTVIWSQNEKATSFLLSHHLILQCLHLCAWFLVKLNRSDRLYKIVSCSLTYKMRYTLLLVLTAQVIWWWRTRSFWRKIGRAQSDRTNLSNWKNKQWFHCITNACQGRMKEENW